MNVINQIDVTDRIDRTLSARVRNQVAFASWRIEGEIDAAAAADPIRAAFAGARRISREMRDGTVRCTRGSGQLAVTTRFLY